MPSLLRHFLAAFAFAALLAAAPATAQGPMPGLNQQFTPAQVEAIERILHDYLRRNPELVIEALEAMEQKRALAKTEQARNVLVTRRDEVFNDPEAPVLGNAKGDVTVVEFFDYRCPYCKQMTDSITRLLREDPNVRLVHKELPILGPESVMASRAALAARNQGKYAQFSMALLRVRGNLDEGTVFRVANELGIDVARLRNDMGSPDFDKIFSRNRALAQALGVDGTPAFVIGDRIVPGAVDFATLKKLVADARAAK